MSSGNRPYFEDDEMDIDPYYHQYEEMADEGYEAPYFEAYAVEDESPVQEQSIEPDWKKNRIPKPNEKLDFKPAPKGRDIFADAITSGTAFLGGPGDLASLAVGDNPLTSKSLREGAFKLIPSLAPDSEQEKEWDENLSLLMGIVTPGGLIKNTGKAIGKGFGKVLGSSSSKLGSKLLKGKYADVYEAGKNLGIDEKALAPFKHGRVTEEALTTVAKLGEEAKNGVKFAESLATPKYKQIFSEAGKVPVNQIATRHVVKGLGDIVKDIEKSPALVKESKDVINFLNEAIHAVDSSENLNLENLIALQKQLGKTVNWKSIKQSGKGHLVQEARSVIEQAIYGVSPKIGQELNNMDKLYAGYKNLAKEVSPNKLVEYASKGGPLGYTLYSILTGHDVQDSIQKGVGIHFGKKALSKVSGKLLTDPKWVDLKTRAIKMIKDGSSEQLPKLIAAIKKKADSDIPDLEEED